MKAAQLFEKARYDFVGIAFEVSGLSVPVGNGTASVQLKATNMFRSHTPHMYLPRLSLETAAAKAAIAGSLCEV